MKKTYRVIYLLLIVLIVLSGCAPAPEPQFIPAETLAAATYAAIVAQTEAAKPTATRVPPTETVKRATLTPYPTNTSFVVNLPTPMPTSTPTPIPTATNVTSGSGNVLYSCNIVSVSPETGVKAKAGQEFKWTWHLENIGTTTWQKNEVMAVYSYGVNYGVKDEVVLKDNTPPGKIAEFRIKMVAPKEPGRYTTTWSLRKGIHYFCYVQLQINVVN